MWAKWRVMGRRSAGPIPRRCVHVRGLPGNKSHCIVMSEDVDGVDVSRRKTVSDSSTDVYASYCHVERLNINMQYTN